MDATGWIKNARTHGPNIGLKRIEVRSSAEEHIEFYRPDQEEELLARLSKQFRSLQVYRQRPHSRKFAKAERLFWGPQPANAERAIVATTASDSLTINTAVTVPPATPEAVNA